MTDPFISHGARSNVAGVRHLHLHLHLHRHLHRRLQRRQPRAFSLIETMVVVAILGILAALGLPRLQEVHQLEQVSAAADAVAGMGTRAQLVAMAERRCVRLFVDATNPRRLVMEKLNSFDCDTSPGAPFIDNSTATTWIEVSSHILEQSSLALSFAAAEAPPPTSPGPGSGTVAREIRFRPSGRLFANDTDVTNDDGAITVTHVSLPAATNKKVLFEAHGRICTLQRGTVLPAGNNWTCP